MVSLDPCCFSSKKLSWLNCCAAFVDWKLISTLKNNKIIFSQVMIRSFLNLVPVIRIANWTRISQSLSVVISHDPYCYLWSKKQYWLKFYLISQTAKSFSTLRNDKPAFLFSQLSVDLAEISKIWKVFIVARCNKNKAISINSYNRDLCCYLSVKKLSWFYFLLFLQI